MARPTWRPDVSAPEAGPQWRVAHVRPAVTPGKNRRFVAGSVLAGFMVLSGLLIWIATWLSPPKPSCLVLIGAGSKVFLPTFSDGAMVYFGDVHAAMGDGEVFLSGVEIAGRVQARVTVATGWSLPTPIVETDELVAVIADGATFDEAAKSAMAKAVEVLTAGGMDPVDAGFLMSAAGHLRVCQYIPNASLVHCRFELPKSILALNQISIPNLQSAR